MIIIVKVVEQSDTIYMFFATISKFIIEELHCENHNIEIIESTHQ